MGKGYRPFNRAARCAPARQVRRYFRFFVCSEGSGAVRALNPNGTFSMAFTVSGAETISFVPLNIGLRGNPVEGF